jgi:hypothetical protein
MSAKSKRISSMGTTAGCAVVKSTADNIATAACANMCALYLFSSNGLAELTALEGVVSAKALLAVSNWLRLCEPASVQLLNVNFVL